MATVDNVLIEHIPGHWSTCGHLSVRLCGCPGKGTNANTVVFSMIMENSLDSFSGPRLIDRLQSARHILANAENPVLTSFSDARSVALAMIHCQDASELVLSALAKHLGIVLGRRDGFEDILKKLVEKTKEEGKQSIGRHERFLRDLNEKRIAFKHYGSLPDVGQNYRVVSQTTERLSDISKDCCGIALASVDIIYLIEDGPTRIHLLNAKVYHSRGQFQEALESISMAMNRASRCLFPMNVVVGDESTKSALLLSGYGINPVCFLTLQKLLPSRLPGSLKSPAQSWWNRRRFGHEANWTLENARFAIETSSEVILKLQCAHPVAEVRDYRYCFHDVVTITSDSPTVFADDMEDESKEPEPVDASGMFSRGNSVICWASTAKTLRGTTRKIRNLDDLDDWVVAYNPQSVPGTPSLVSELGVLYFRTDEVSVTDHRDDVEVLYSWRKGAWLDEDTPRLLDANI